MSARVLIVDDHAPFRALARRLLTADGFERCGRPHAPTGERRDEQEGKADASEPRNEAEPCMPTMVALRESHTNPLDAPCSNLRSLTLPPPHTLDATRVFGFLPCAGFSCNLAPSTAGCDPPDSRGRWYGLSDSVMLQIVQRCESLASLE